jgi:hypothetical protein
MALSKQGISCVFNGNSVKCLKNGNEVLIGRISRDMYRVQLNLWIGVMQQREKPRLTCTECSVMPLEGN